MDHVKAKDVIADTLLIKLRQKTGSELSFVTITNTGINAAVNINVKGVPPGSYSLVLESID